MNDKELMIYEQIIDIAKKYDVDKIILFGSRARGTNSIKSDIDLAIYGSNNFQNLYFDLNENVDTLLSFDIIDMNRNISKELLQEIARDGVILYEKI